MAQPILFANADFNKKYQINAEEDQEIITPDGYNGKISGIQKEATIEGILKRNEGRGTAAIISLKKPESSTPAK
jgi:hypothetical protein